MQFLIYSELESLLKRQKDEGSKERQSLKDELQELKDLINLRKEELDEVVKKKNTLEDAIAKGQRQKNEGIAIEEKEAPVVRSGTSVNERPILNERPIVNERQVDALARDDRQKSDEMKIEDLEETSGVQHIYRVS